jgi:hypothetical protein
MGRSNLPSERIALGPNSSAYRWRSRVETEFCPDLLGRNRLGSCLDLGKSFPRCPGVGEVLQQLAELLRGEVLQLCGQLSGDDGR